MKDLNVDLILDEMIKEIENSKQLLYLKNITENKKQKNEERS